MMKHMFVKKVFINGMTPRGNSTTRTEKEFGSKPATNMDSDKTIRRSE
jgi:hypothetical protein